MSALEGYNTPLTCNIVKEKKKYLPRTVDPDSFFDVAALFESIPLNQFE